MGSSHDGSTAVAGLFQLMEIRFARRLQAVFGGDQFSATCAWGSVKSTASALGLQGCAVGQVVMRYPPVQLERMLAVRIVEVLPDGGVEFAHRSWQEWFAAGAVISTLTAGFTMSDDMVAALRRPENDMLRRFALAIAPNAGAADAVVGVLWDAGKPDFSAVALQPLAEALPDCPHASRLSIRTTFAAKAAEVCAAVRSPPHARDTLFDVAAFWAVADAVTGGEQVAWAIERCSSFASSLWAWKSPVPALAATDVLIHVQPRSAALASCLRAVAGLRHVELRIRAVLLLTLTDGADAASARDTLTRVLLGGSQPAALRVEAWRVLLMRFGASAPTLLGDAASTVLRDPGCPPELLRAVASTATPSFLTDAALDAAAASSVVPDASRRDHLAERMMWRRGLDATALRYDSSWTLQHVAACCGQCGLLTGGMAGSTLTSRGWSLLHCAAQAGNVAALTTLLPSATRDDVWRVDAEGCTPALLALRGDHVDVCSKLVTTFPADTVAASQLWAEVTQRRLHRRGVQSLAELGLPVPTSALCALMPHVNALRIVEDNRVASVSWGDGVRSLQASSCSSLTARVLGIAAPSIRELRLDNCPALPSDFTSGSSGLVQLEVLEHRSCPPLSSSTLAGLPPTLTSLTVSLDSASGIVSLGHLPKLTALCVWGVAGGPRGLVLTGCRLLATLSWQGDCSSVGQVTLGGNSSTLVAELARLPPSLRHLDLGDGFPASAAVSFAHLPLLTAFKAPRSPWLSDAAVLSLPASVVTLDLSGCPSLSPALRFTAFTALQRVSVAGCSRVDNAVIASLPPSVEEVDVSRCMGVTSAVRFAHLPRLRVLIARDVSWLTTALVATLPTGLLELVVPRGCSVSPGSKYAHLPALRVIGG